MATNATRVITIGYTGDVNGTNTLSAAASASSPGSITTQTLAPGNNTITVPSTAGITVKGATFLPPTGNTVAITLKGVAGDTGFEISRTDPTSIGFETAPASIVLNATTTIGNFRIFWT